MPNPFDYRQPAPAYYTTSGSGFLTIPASTTVAVNDLVVLSEAGTVAPYNANLSIGQSNNNTNSPVSILSPANLTGLNYEVCPYTYGVNSTAVLPNGNIVRQFSGNGTLNYANLNIQIINQAGGLIAQYTISSGQVYWHQVFVLSSGRILVNYADNNTNMKFMVFNSDLTVYTAATTYYATLPYSSNMNMPYFIQLVGGTLVFFYQKTTTIDLAFIRYTEAGAVIGTEVTIDTGSSTNQMAYFYAIPCANGDMAMTWMRYNGSQYPYYIARYSSAGTIVGSKQTVTSIASSYGTQGNYYQALIELSNGNFAFSGPQTAQPYQCIYIYSSSLTLVKLVDLTYGGAFSQNSTMPVNMVLNGAGFSVFWAMTGGQYFASIDNSGNILTPATVTGGSTYGMVPSGGNSNYAQVYYMGAFGYAIAYSYNVSPGGILVIETFTPQGKLRGSVTVDTNTGGQVMGGFAFVSPNLFYTHYCDPATSVNRIKYAAYNLQRSTILGVAQTAGSTSVKPQIATIGTFTINQNVGFGGAFDTRANTVAGNRGIIAGNSAYLLGPI